MGNPDHPKPLVIDSLTGITWYDVVPEEVINLDKNPNPTNKYGQGQARVCGLL